jgi:hypothetical protein
MVENRAAISPELMSQSMLVSTARSPMTGPATPAAAALTENESPTSRAKASRMAVKLSNAFVS